jgi:hypothetical protein
MTPLFASRLSKSLRTACLLSLAAWLLYLSVLAPSLSTWDGGGMLNASISLIQKHDWTVDPIYGQPGRNGKLYGMWYPLLSIVAVPFVAVGLVFARIAHLPPTYVAAVFAIFVSTIIAALNVGATYYLARESLGASEQSAILAGLCFGFCTLSLAYSRTFYADPLSTLVTILVLIAMFSETPNGPALFALCCLAILAKPVGVLVVGVVFLYLVFHRKYVAAAYATAGSILGCLLFAGYDWIRFGNVLKSGQPNFWGVHEFPEAFTGLLFSPGVGIFIGCPVLFLLFAKRLNSKTAWIAALALIHVVFYSFWGRWYSSDWGPRFLMPVLPALIAVSVLTKYRRTWLALAAVGLLIQLPTSFGSPERHSALLRSEGIQEETAVWHPELSSTFGMWRSAIEQVESAQNQDVREFSTFRPTSSSFADARNFRIVPLWWWMLPLVHIPRIVGAIIALFELALGIWIIARLLASARASELNVGTSPSALP